MLLFSTLKKICGSVAREGLLNLPPHYLSNYTVALSLTFGMTYAKQLGLNLLVNTGKWAAYEK